MGSARRIVNTMQGGRHRTPMSAFPQAQGSTRCASIDNCVTPAAFPAGFAGTIHELASAHVTGLPPAADGPNLAGRRLAGDSVQASLPAVRVRCAG